MDPNRREALRRLIARVQRDRRLTTLVITHDRAEAAELAETLALMLEGRIIQQAEPREIFERPTTAAVARFFGTGTILRGTVARGLLQLDDGAVLPVAGPDGPATCVIRPEAVSVDEAGPLRAEVVEAIYAGTHVRLVLRRGDLRITAHVAPGTQVGVGSEIGLDLPADRLWRIPNEDRQVSAGS